MASISYPPLYPQLLPCDFAILFTRDVEFTSSALNLGCLSACFSHGDGY